MGKPFEKYATLQQYKEMLANPAFETITSQDLFQEEYHALLQQHSEWLARGKLEGKVSDDASVESLQEIQDAAEHLASLLNKHVKITATPVASYRSIRVFTPKGNVYVQVTTL